jgi:hypothetical protein
MAATQIVPNLQTLWPKMPTTDETAAAHVVYRLGPELPGLPIPNGKQYRASRLWVLLDQLLISDSLDQAHARTRALRDADTS